MNKNFIKIEIDDSAPLISIEYQNIGKFQELIFLLMSSSGIELIYQSLKKDLTLNGRVEELGILDSLVNYLSSNDASQEEQFIDPSSFQ
jgi:hypothetical protein